MVLKMQLNNNSNKLGTVSILADLLHANGLTVRAAEVETAIFNQLGQQKFSVRSDGTQPAILWLEPTQIIVAPMSEAQREVNAAAREYDQLRSGKSAH